MGVVGDLLVDRREDMVRDDPRVRQAEKITEAAKMRLMTAVDAGDVRESWRLMRIFGRAVLLQGETEDDARVRLGLLAPDDAALRKLARREDLAEPLGDGGRPGLVTMLLGKAAAWLTRIAMARRDAHWAPGRVGLPPFGPDGPGPRERIMDW